MPGEAERLRRAATAVWLARVASNRPGVVQRVVRHFGSLDEALDASLARLRAVLAPRSGGDLGSAANADGRGRAAAANADGRARAAAAKTLEASRFVKALADPLAAPPRLGEGRLFVTFDDALYPARLRLLFDPPPALFVAGVDAPRRLGALNEAPVVAVVGTRAPSSYGREMARLLAGDLARAGVVVVSGIALGVDVCAQLSALEAGNPSDGRVPPSVGVLGCGIDVVHPRSNAAAFRALRERGLLISEFWPGTPPSVWRFPARNRVIAGLSQAVVVVEGSRRSGSRITAGLAVDAGREVLAVPGEAGRRLSEAPHHLIREGAHLCEAADDVLAVLGLERTYGGTRNRGDGATGTVEGVDEAEAHGPLDEADGPGTHEDAGGRTLDVVGAGSPVAATDLATAATGLATAATDLATDTADLATDARAVLDALRDAPGPVGELAARSALEVRAVAAALSTLEIEGLAERTDGGVYRRLR